MLKNYTPAEYRTVTEYELVFDDGRNNGFGFPCDREGHPLQSAEENPAAHENLVFCLAHPEKFERFNKVVEQKWRTRENAHGICSCGEDVELWDQYLGACQCPKCGQWYNLFGQELVSPEYWETDPSEEEW